METADYWLFEKQLVHKLFKVLSPRYENFKVSYTRMYKAPREFPGSDMKRAVLELRGNPYPPLKPDYSQNRGLIHNVLLDEAKKQYRKEKYAEIATKLTASGTKVDVTDDRVVDVKSNETLVMDDSNKTETLSVNKEETKDAPT